MKASRTWALHACCRQQHKSPGRRDRRTMPICAHYGPQLTVTRAVQCASARALQLRNSLAVLEVLPQSMASDSWTQGERVDRVFEDRASQDLRLFTGMSVVIRWTLSESGTVGLGTLVSANLQVCR